MRYLICLLSALFFAYELVQFHMMNAICPYLMKDLGLQATSFGNLCATYLLADVIFLLPAGMILDRFAVHKVMVAALGCCLMGTFAFAAADSFYMAACAHFLSGIGNAFCLLSSLILVSRWFEVSKQALMMSLVVTIGMLGAVVAQSPFAYLATLFSWRSALIIDGCIGILLLLLIMLFVRDRPSKEVRTSYPFWQGLRLSLGNSQNLLLGLYTSLVNMPLMVIGAVFGSLFLMQVHGLSLQHASLVTSMISLGTIVGSTLFGWLATKTNKMRTWMFVGAAASLLLFSQFFCSLIQGVVPLATLFFLLGLSTSTQVLSYPLLARHNPKELTGTAMGVAAVIIMGLPMLVQPLTGALLDYNWEGKMVEGAAFYSSENFSLAFSVFPIGLLIALLCTYFVKEKSTQTYQQSSVYKN